MSIIDNPILLQKKYTCVSDMQCMNDDQLAEDLLREYQERTTA